MGRHKSGEDLRSRSFPVSVDQDIWMDEVSKQKKISRAEIVRVALAHLMKNQNLLEEALQKKENKIAA